MLQDLAAYKCFLAENVTVLQLNKSFIVMNILFVCKSFFCMQSKFQPGRDPGPINTEVVSFSHEGDKNFLHHFYIAIVDEGACIALTSVRIFYQVCPEEIHHLAHFEKTVAGPYDTSLIPVSETFQR